MKSPDVQKQKGENVFFRLSDFTRCDDYSTYFPYWFMPGTLAPPILVLSPFYVYFPPEITMLFIICLIIQGFIHAWQHRYTAHKGWKTYTIFDHLICLIGCLTQPTFLESIYIWEIGHVHHHTHCDQVGDQHSPFIRCDLHILIFGSFYDEQFINRPKDYNH
eukprot:UN23456